MDRPIVIKAGTLIDGASDTPRRNVSIVIRDGIISAVETGGAVSDARVETLRRRAARERDRKPAACRDRRPGRTADPDRGRVEERGGIRVNVDRRRHPPCLRYRSGLLSQSR